VIVRGLKFILPKKCIASTKHTRDMPRTEKQDFVL
jgi:hypothetical protein